jgi:hypothetical protein
MNTKNTNFHNISRIKFVWEPPRKQESGIFPGIVILELSKRHIFMEEQFSFNWLDSNSSCSPRKLEQTNLT